MIQGGTLCEKRRCDVLVLCGDGDGDGDGVAGGQNAGTMLTESEGALHEVGLQLLATGASGNSFLSPHLALLGLHRLLLRSFSTRAPRHRYSSPDSSRSWVYPPQHCTKLYWAAASGDPDLSPTTLVPKLPAIHQIYPTVPYSFTLKPRVMLLLGSCHFQFVG